MCLPSGAGLQQGGRERGLSALSGLRPVLPCQPERQGGCCSAEVSLASRGSHDSAGHLLCIPCGERQQGTSYLWRLFPLVQRLWPSPQGWCRDNFIHQRNMRTALDVRAQLVDLCGRQGVELVSSGDSRAVRRALLEGLRAQTAEHAGEGKYRTVRGPQLVVRAASSPLLSPNPAAGHEAGGVHTPVLLPLPYQTTPTLCHVFPISAHHQVLHEVRLQLLLVVMTV